MLKRLLVWWNDCLEESDERGVLVLLFWTIVVVLGFFFLLSWVLGQIGVTYQIVGLVFGICVLILLFCIVEMISTEKSFKSQLRGQENYNRNLSVEIDRLETRLGGGVYCFVGIPSLGWMFLEETKITSENNSICFKDLSPLRFRYVLPEIGTIDEVVITPSAGSEINVFVSSKNIKYSVIPFTVADSVLSELTKHEVPDI